ncbi:MAG: type VI secretion system baseplate subunit TssG [Acidobacteria bacterium]|nr:type VI secretion system baseplate subunit TssG [Acidobacteriota bacterium]
MATYGWRQDRAVAEGLFGEGHRFSFLQAVRLLEELFPDRTPPAEGVDPRRELVRFRHRVRLDYPPTDVEEIKPPTEDEPAEMTVNVLGLAGVLGPLPPAITELIMERSFRKDTALRDFLDIFNHRLVSLLYRARKKYRPALDSQAPANGRVANVLYAFLGLGTAHLRGRMDLPDRALLPFAGLAVDRFRSTVGLIRILEDHFEVPVEISQFHGRWQHVEPDDWTRIGRTGMNRRLGVNATLGTKYWDQAASFEIVLGALSFDRFLSFLPIGRAHKPLLAAVRYYVREELGFTIRLLLRAAEVPELRLGRAEGAFLGWTTWLKTKPTATDDSQVRLMGK